MTAPAAELEELKALLARALERIEKLQASETESRVVDREPPAEAYADVMARRRRRGR